MPINRPQERSIVSAVNQVSIGNNRTVIHPDSLNELWESLRDKEPWGKVLDSMYDLYQIFDMELKAIRQHIPNNYEGLLADVNGGQLASHVVEAVKNFLNSFPRSYYFCIELPRVSPFGLPEIKLAQDLSLVDTSSGYDEERLKAGTGLLPATTMDGKLKRDAVYLRISVNGFGSYLADSQANSLGISRFKHFVFMGLETGELRKRTLADFLNPTSADRVFNLPHAVIYNPNVPDEAYDAELPSDIADIAKSIKIDESNLLFLDFSKGKTVLDGEYRPPENPDENVQAVKHALARTMKFMQLPEDNTDVINVKAAMEWYVDADQTSNETIAYIQRCIGLETLLGDQENKDRVTDKLADRYSYLLGNTISERKSLKNDFLDVYGKRSGIVHGRDYRLKLPFNERNKPKEMLKNCILRELVGIYSSLQKT